MHPLDLVKTRFQIQSNIANDPNNYNGIADCMRKMYRSEGMLSFWKGVIPPILVETPKRAWKVCDVNSGIILSITTHSSSFQFFTFEQFKSILIFSKDQPQSLTFSLAGLGSGVTEAIMVNPFEVVKVRMQANRAHQAQAPSTGQVWYPSGCGYSLTKVWMQVMKEIIREEGFLRHGLLGKGITATMGRNGAFNMIYFGFYHTFR